MPDESINITGLAETQRALYQFSERLGDRVTVLALRVGANYLLRQIRDAAPKKTGRLRRAIVVRNSRINRRRVNGKVGLYIQVKPGRTRNDPKGALYGQWVERGYKARGKTDVAPRHFVTATFAAHKQAALDAIITAVEQGGQRLISEINNRT